LGLRVPSTHTPLPLGAQGQQIFDDMRAIGCTRIITGFGPDQFKTPDLVKASCDLFNQAYEACKANGFTFGLHNHWWEYQKVEGRYVYQMMDELLDPAIQFEMDTYWVKTAGVDPAVAIEELGQRVTLLHVKDGPAVRDAPMTAVGEGVLDFPVIIKAATYTEWLIVELDRCATDMFEAVRKSVEYLKKIQ
jgi:sugar phosphate isomerase/epimerase